MDEIKRTFAKVVAVIESEKECISEGKGRADQYVLACRAIYQRRGKNSILWRFVY